MSTQISGPVQVLAQDIFTTSSVQQHQLGTVAFTADGRKFRYAAVNALTGGPTGTIAGVTLVTGNVLQAPAQIANHLALAPTVAQAVGDTSFTVTLGATAAFANQYAGGYAIVSTTPGNGFAYLIKGHPAAAASAVLTLNLSDAIQVATTTASRIDLQQNMYSGVIQTPVTTATGATVGVAVNPIAAPASSSTVNVQNFGWIQTGGPAAVLITGTPAVGNTICGGNTAAAGAAAITSGTLNNIGYMLSTGVSGKNNAAYLTIE
jgi:hypothetical protein